MIRRILVPLDPSPFAATATDYACQIANAHGAEVTGLMVLDTPAIHDSVSHVSPGAAPFAKKAENRLESEAHQKIQETLGVFAEKCEKAGVEHREVEDQGDPGEQIIEAAAFYDLVVVGLRTHFHFATAEEPRSQPHKIVGQMLTPILAVPDEFKPLGDSVDVAIAYDGSAPAIRSLRQFTQLAAFSNPNVMVITAHDDMEAAQELCEPVSDYLKAYGFTDIEIEWTPKDIKDVLRDRILQEADVLVLGMHSKTGLFDFGAGSVTDFVIRESTKPVFIGH